MALSFNNIQFRLLDLQKILCFATRATFNNVNLKLLAYELIVDAATTNSIFIYENGGESNIDRKRGGL
ncbi:MAG: hypothetical protein AB7E42_08820 [Anaerotignaceae bacterium]